MVLSLHTWVCTLFVVYSSHSSNIYIALKNVYKYLSRVWCTAGGSSQSMKCSAAVGGGVLGGFVGGVLMTAVVEAVILLLSS